MHSKPYYSQPRLTPIMPVGDPDACLVGAYPACPPRHATVLSSSPNSSPTLHDLSPMAYNKCLPNSPTHAAPPGPIVPTIQETPGHPNLAHPASPDHSSSMGMLHSQGSPNHLNSPGPHGYHPIYANSSPSSSPVSHPSTPGGAAESPFIQSYSPSQAQVAASSAHTRGSSPSLLCEDASPPSLAITVKQEPQELDQMYLDDGELLSSLFHRIIIYRSMLFFWMKTSLYELSVHAKSAVYVAHRIYLTPFAYLLATTHNRTLLHLSVFPDEILAADLRQICLILDRSRFICFWCNVRSGLCCPSGCFALKQ